MRPAPRGRYPIAMKNILAAALLSLFLAPSAAAADKPAMSELLRAAGIEFPPPVATPSAAPVRMAAPGEVRASGAALESVTMGCTLSLDYSERVSGMAMVSVWREISGTAVLRCPDMPPLKLLLRGEGLSLRAGPADGLVSLRENKAVAEYPVRVPHLFAPKHVDGSYHNAGGELRTAGGAYTPWVNANGTFASTLYLPSAFGSGSGVELKSLSLRLAR